MPKPPDMTASACVSHCWGWVSQQGAASDTSTAQPHAADKRSGAARSGCQASCLPHSSQKTRGGLNQGLSKLSEIEVPGIHLGHVFKHDQAAAHIPQIDDCIAAVSRSDPALEIAEVIYAGEVGKLDGVPVAEILDYVEIPPLEESLVKTNVSLPLPPNRKSLPRPPSSVSSPPGPPRNVLLPESPINTSLYLEP